MKLSDLNRITRAAADKQRLVADLNRLFDCEQKIIADEGVDAFKERAHKIQCDITDIEMTMFDLGVVVDA